MRRRTALVAVVVMLASLEGAASAAAVDTMAQRVQPCTICHGAEGRASNEGYFPRIAGKPTGYLFHQLLHFRDGYRDHVQMRYLLERQQDAYLKAMAAYFAALDLPYPSPAAPQRSVADRALGERLVRDGDADRGVPACQACHGMRMTGVAPDIPGLLGLPYDYLVAQFGNWRGGLRRTRAPDCMAILAHRLTEAEVAATAAWLAAQPLPADPHPAQQLPGPMPMECGTVDAGGGP